MTTTFMPLGGRVLIKRVGGEKQVGSIHVPDGAQKESNKAEVFAVGLGKRLADGSHLDPMVTEGDKVLVSKYGGMEIEIDGLQLFIVQEADIQAIIS